MKRTTILLSVLAASAASAIAATPASAQRYGDYGGGYYQPRYEHDGYNEDRRERWEARRRWEQQEARQRYRNDERREHRWHEHEEREEDY